MSAAGSAPGPGRRRTRLLAALLAAAVAAAGGAYWVLVPGPPAPPAVELSGADPDVRAAVEARARLAMGPGVLHESVESLRCAAAAPQTRKAAGRLLGQVYARLGDASALAFLGDVDALPDDSLQPHPFGEQAEALHVGLV